MNLEFLSALPDLAYDRIYLSYLAGGLVAVGATAYAFQVYREKLFINSATWFMILCIDVLGLILALTHGSSHPIIHIVWVVTDIFICVAAITLHKRFYWNRIDSLSLIFFLLSLIWWHFSASLIAVLGYLVACFFTLLPQAIQYWHNKNIARRSAWVWIMSSVALMMTVLSLETISLEYGVLTSGLLLFYTGMVFVAFRT